MKRFNTTGTCFPEKHYMVNIDRQVNAAAELVRQGDYLCINRGRQYGKTTTLAALNRLLESDFCVFNISFEGLDDSDFSSASTVCAEFLKILKRWSKVNGSTEDMKALLKEVVPFGCKEISSSDFADIIDELCELSDKPIVVMIDEVDQASNNDGFIKFLGTLRNMYLSRNKFKTFQSVILAGVYDVKNLKLKIRSDEDHQYNSPWNIAVPFNEDMSLPEDGIAVMLKDYATEHDMEFDEAYIAKEIHSYTAGYPFLVSRLCQIIDESNYTWDKEGVLKAVNNILYERNTLFDDLTKKLEQFPELKRTLMSILYTGDKFSYSPYEKYIQLGIMFSFITNDSGVIKIACRLMETMLYSLFITEENQSVIYGKGSLEKNQFVHDGYIDMQHLLERFSVHFNDIFRTKVDTHSTGSGHAGSPTGEMDMEFIEKQGRKQFLLYMRPIINGIGNYYVEAETRDQTRTDVVIDYLGQQYVIELKIWHGDSYNTRGEQQLREYLDYFHLKKGYLVSFCFNKGKQPGVHTVKVGNCEIIEAIV